MTTQALTNLTEAELFYHYLGKRIASGARNMTAAALMAEFEEYNCQLQEVRAKLREAEASSARGESGPLDLDALMARVEQRWDAKGVAE